MSITAERIVELFEKDVRARKRLAELLVIEPDVRLAIINAVLRDVATKNDIEKLRISIEDLRAATKKDIEDLIKETREEIENLRKEVRREIERLKSDLKSYVDARFESLSIRIDDLYKLVRVTLVAIAITLATTVLVPLFLKLAFGS